MKNILSVPKSAALPLLSLLLALCLLAGSTFAWLFIGDRIRPLGLQMTKINSEVWFCSATDTNRNGIPDRLPSPVSSLTYQGETHSYYYDEAYHFTCFGRDYALSDTPVSVTVMSTETELYPSQYLTYKLILLNKSDMANSIRFRYTAKTGMTADEALFLSAVSVRVGAVGVDGFVSFGEPVYFSDFITPAGDGYAVSEVTVNETPYTLPAMVNIAGNEDYWLQIIVTPYPELAARAPYAALGFTQSDYNGLQGNTLILPDFRVLFEIDI